MQTSDGLALTASPGRRVVTLSLAGALFVAILGLRLLVDDAHEPVLVLLVLPIAVVAFELGVVGGLVAGVFGILVFALWNELSEEQLGTLAYVVRAVSFLVVGGGIGLMSQRQRESAEALRRSNESLRQANQDLEQFAYMAAHDLQSPLAVVAGFAALVRDRYRERLDDDGAQFLDYMAQGVSDMQELIQGMLQIARGGASGLERIDVDTADLVAEVVAGLDEDLEGRDVEIEVRGLPEVVGDPQRLRQVFVNLLSNAVKFSDDPARVEVRARRDGRAWRFDVRDNGIGVPPADAERIFEPLQRVETGRRGVGIGLAVCRRIVESHGGEIAVVPAGSSGSVFTFTLPDAPPEQ